MSTVRKSNLKEIEIAIKKNFKTLKRKKGGFYVFGETKEIVAFIDKCYEIASIDCPSIEGFTYREFFDPNDERKCLGIAYLGGK